MPLRRSVRLLTTGALLVAISTLSACGFDYATDRVYTPGAGTNNRDASVDVLSATVVSAEDGSGTLIAGLSNDDGEKATVEAIAGAGDTADLTIEGFSTITIPPEGFVNLADLEEPIIVTGDFAVGEFLTLAFSLGNGETVEMEVTTVQDCYEYAGLDASADAGTPADECQPEAPAVEK